MDDNATSFELFRVRLPADAKSRELLVEILQPESKRPPHILKENLRFEGEVTYNNVRGMRCSLCPSEYTERTGKSLPPDMDLIKKGDWFMTRDWADDEEPSYDAYLNDPDSMMLMPEEEWSNIFLLNEDHIVDFFMVARPKFN